MKGPPDPSVHSPKRPQCPGLGQGRKQVTGTPMWWQWSSTGTIFSAFPGTSQGRMDGKQSSQTQTSIPVWDAGLWCSIVKRQDYIESVCVTLMQLFLTFRGESVARNHNPGRPTGILHSSCVRSGFPGGDMCSHLPFFTSLLWHQSATLPQAYHASSWFSVSWLWSGKRF